MKSKTILLPLAVLLILLALACSESNDLGAPCFLVKKNPDSTDVNNPVVHITEEEAQRALQGPTTGDKDSTVVRDLVSLGAPECEDSVCLRDSALFVPAPPADNAYARGYCSLECFEEGATCKASKNSKVKYICRPMLLDLDAWQQACEVNPTNCLDMKTTLYCAREI